MLSLKKILSSDGLAMLWEGILRLHLRFPFTLLCSLVGTALAVNLINSEGEGELLAKCFFTAVVGVSYFFSAEMLAERRPKYRWWAILGVFGFLGIFYFCTEYKGQLPDNHVFPYRTLGLIAAGHLLVSFVPYLGIGSTNSFWQYNKTLFIAILTAFLYSFTLAGGLVLALLAIDNLFDLKIDGKHYGHIMVMINGYVNTLLFLSNLKSLAEIDAENDYPKGLKYFTQYVLLPLVGIYVLILMSYEAKIIFQQKLPRGWVSSLVLASGIFGILAFLLVYPLRNVQNWVAKLNRYYYLVLIPLVGLLLVSIYTRIGDYGITEPRYVVAILGVWLLAMALYFSFFKNANIKVIPISLALLAMFCVYGPLSSFDVSSRNQQHRLDTALQKNKLLDNGIIKTIDNKKVSTEDNRAILAAFDYLSHAKIEVLQKYFSKTDFQKIKEANRWAKYSTIKHILKIEIDDTQLFDNYISAKTEPYKILFGADYSTYLNKHELPKEFSIAKNSFRISEQKDLLLVTINGENAAFDLQNLKKIQKQAVPQSELTLTQETENWELHLVLNEIVLDENKEFSDFNGNLYFKNKKP